MGSKGIFEDNKLQKGMPEYVHYAKKSLVFAIIVLCSLLVLWLSGLLIDLSVRINNDIIDIIVNLIFVVVFPLAMITDLVLAILGVIFGKKGLKSRKAGVQGV